MIGLLHSLALVCALGAFAGCTSIGTQYQVPRDDESFAQLRKSGGFRAVILNYDQQGCYAGRTDVADGAKLRVGEEVVIESSAPVRIGTMDARCSVMWGLTPQAGATYGMRFKLDGRGNVDFVGGRCMADLIQVAPNGSESLVPARNLRLSVRKVACIRAEPLR